ncbi:hypothetical protein [Ciceribacter sp. L1K22]|uniref:hypothetical protein n=1 Tax=Ciceribacter sp. L1K22 TaxID=2820275 RepID=UPI001ABECC6D|nr:hypothetical protein [Ciceribacter sp. L1K22]MBO3759503.1 hypothetical protein [Ciceribacter sp. L1K22]
MIKQGMVIVAVVSVLSACTTSGGSSGGGLLGGRTKNSTVYITALQGGIVQRSGVQLSSSDRQRALEAEYRALEAAPGGQPVVWSGGNVRGEVVAAAPYQVGAQNCRQYSHKVTTGSRLAEARGAACRNSDGTWTPLT